MSNENEDIRIVTSDHDPDKTAVLARTKLPFPCTWEGCRKGPFKSERSLRMHTIRAHTHPWSTSQNFLKGKKRKLKHGKAAEIRRQKYRQTVAAYHARGLNAHGEPFGRSPLAKAMRKSWARRATQKGKELLNGAITSTPNPEQPTDNMGDTARAIIMAAQVLRSVSLGMKL